MRARLSTRARLSMRARRAVVGGAPAVAAGVTGLLVTRRGAARRGAAGRIRAARRAALGAPVVAPSFVQAAVRVALLVVVDAVLPAGVLRVTRIHGVTNGR